MPWRNRLQHDHISLPINDGTRAFPDAKLFAKPMRNLHFPFRKEVNRVRPTSSAHVLIITTMRSILGMFLFQSDMIPIQIDSIN